MPEPLPDSALRLSRHDRRALALLIVLAVFVQAAGMAGVRHLRGQATAYAFQSPDAGEYVALARGIAWTGQYVPLDTDCNPLGGPDTWRTPGYPLFLAFVVRVGNDSPLTLLVAQQLVAVATVPLLWLVLRRLTRPGWALLAALAWCFDPFRVFYSLWLMSETLFTFVLLLGCWVWVGKGSGFRAQGSGGDAAATSAPFRYPHSAFRTCLLLGLLSGLLVLIRPIALPLPLIALVGVAVAGWRVGWRKWAVLNLACLLGVGATLGPWLVRNRVVGGHFALSSQSGASLAYHKVVDVVLWSEGRPERRFDAAATTEVREAIDLRLRHEWPEVHGPATPEQLETLTWRNLNFGKPVGVDPFEASSMLWSISVDMLAGRLWAMTKCFVVQGLFMLSFPLGLVVWPPAGAGSAPLSTLFGGGGVMATKIVPAIIGGAYGLLGLWIAIRLVAAAVRRQWPAGSFALWPALAMFAFSLPSEDPRFRLPLIPLFWILAVAGGRFAFRARPGSNPRA